MVPQQVVMLGEPVDDPRFVKVVAAEVEGLCGITSTGKVYMAGIGDFGRHGLGTEQDQCYMSRLSPEPNPTPCPTPNPYSSA